MNFAYCTDHRPVQPSRIRSAVNQLCFVKPSALIYVCARAGVIFFSPSLSLFFFPPPPPLPRCKQGGAARRDVFRRPWNLGAGEGQEDLKPRRVTRASSFSRKALRCAAAAGGAKGVAPSNPSVDSDLFAIFFSLPHQLGEATQSKRK